MVVLCLSCELYKENEQLHKAMVSAGVTPIRYNALLIELNSKAKNLSRAFDIGFDQNRHRHMALIIDEMRIESDG